MLAVRASLRAQRRDLAIASGVAAVTLLPSPWDWPLSVLVLALTGSWFALSLRLLQLATPRWLRIMRAHFYRISASRFDVILFLAATGMYLVVGAFVFGWIPAIQDTQAQLFHATLFAEGQVTAAAPPGPQALFAADNMIYRDGLWYSQYPIGHSAVLALGVIVGAPYLINPVLGACTLVLLRRFVAETVSRQTGRRAALLGLVSPFSLFMNSEYMNHTSTLFAAVCLAWGTVRGTKPGGNWWWGALAGFGAGWMLLTRPLTAVSLGLPFGAWYLVSAWRVRERAGALFASIAVAAISLGIMLWFQAATNGHPLRSGYAVCYPNFSYGFTNCPNTNLPVGPYFGLLDAIEHLLSNLNAMNLFTFGGSLPALGLAALGAWHGWKHLGIRLVSTSAITLTIGYFFLCWQDLTFGPRYLYEASLAVIPLSAVGIGELAPRRPKHIVVSAIALGVLLFTPAIGTYYSLIYSHREGIVAEAEHSVPRPERAIVFVDGRYHRAFHGNTPHLDGRIIYARDLGDAENCAGANAFPDRVPYRAVGARVYRYADVCESR